MMSDWYQRLFPTRLAPRRQAVPEFETTQQGSRIATSVGGVLIGRSFGSGSTPSRSGPVANCSSGCRLSIPVSIRTGSCDTPASPQRVAARSCAATGLRNPNDGAWLWDPSRSALCRSRMIPSQPVRNRRLRIVT